MVESSGLLNRRRVISSTGGSNPPLSASSIVYRQSDYYVRPRRGYAVMKNGQTLAENVAKNPGLLLGDGR